MEIFETSSLNWICNIKTIKICLNQHARASSSFSQRILEKKTLEIVSGHTFVEFFDSVN